MKNIVVAGTQDEKRNMNHSIGNIERKHVITETLNSQDNGDLTNEVKKHAILALNKQQSNDNDCLMYDLDDSDASSIEMGSHALDKQPNNDTLNAATIPVEGNDIIGIDTMIVNDDNDDDDDEKKKYTCTLPTLLINDLNDDNDHDTITQDDLVYETTLPTQHVKSTLDEHIDKDTQPPFLSTIHDSFLRSPDQTPNNSIEPKQQEHRSSTFNVPNHVSTNNDDNDDDDIDIISLVTPLNSTKDLATVQRSSRRSKHRLSDIPTDKIVKRRRMILDNNNQNAKQLLLPSLSNNTSEFSATVGQIVCVDTNPGLVINVNETYLAEVLPNECTVASTDHLDIMKKVLQQQSSDIIKHCTSNRPNSIGNNIKNKSVTKHWNERKQKVLEIKEPFKHVDPDNEYIVDNVNSPPSRTTLNVSDEPSKAKVIVIDDDDDEVGIPSALTRLEGIDDHNDDNDDATADHAIRNIIATPPKPSQSPLSSKRVSSNAIKNDDDNDDDASPPAADAVNSDIATPPKPLHSLSERVSLSAIIDNDNDIGFQGNNNKPTAFMLSGFTPTVSKSLSDAITAFGGRIYSPKELPTYSQRRNGKQSLTFLSKSNQQININDPVFVICRPDKNSGSSKRTVKVLFSWARGIPAFTQKWIERCIKETRLVEPTSSECLSITMDSTTAIKKALNFRKLSERHCLMPLGIEDRVFYNYCIALYCYDSNIYQSWEKEWSLLLNEAGATVIKTEYCGCLEKFTQPTPKKRKRKHKKHELKVGDIHCKCDFANIIIVPTGYDVPSELKTLSDNHSIDICTDKWATTCIISGNIDVNKRLFMPK